MVGRILNREKYRPWSRSPQSPSTGGLGSATARATHPGLAAVILKAHRKMQSTVRRVFKAIYLLSAILGAWIGNSQSDTKPAPHANGSIKYSTSPGLSQVLGTVLQQLSVSAWVPAAMLVGNVAVLLQLLSDRSYNVASAVKELAGKPLGMVIILIFS